MTDPDPFEFRVRHHDERTLNSVLPDVNGNQMPPLVVPERWEVDLPHQCEEWIITAGDQAFALAALDDFIAQAHAAREALAAGVEFGQHTAGDRHY